MADFSRYVITNKGRQLIAKVSSNPDDSLIFTKFETSDKKYEVEELPPLQTLAQIKQSGNVTSITNEEEEYQYKINGSINTLDLEAGYFLQTIGLYAKSKVDNEEILFAITTTLDENKADWVSENGAMNTSQILLTATFIITNTDVKSVIVNVDGYTPITTFVEHTDKTKDVHGATSEADINKIIIRDNEGTAKVKYPTNPVDDSIVNKKAVEDRLIKYKNDNTNESNVVNYWKEDRTYQKNDVVAIEAKYTNPATQQLEEHITAILFYKALKTTTGNKPDISAEYWQEIKTAGDLDKNLVIAKDVQYDADKSQITTITGYDFPLFKNEISNFEIKLHNGTSEDTFNLTKENEKSYKISGSTASNTMYYEDGLRIKLTSINSKTSFLDMFEQIAIYYPITLEDSGEYIDVQGNEIAISEISEPLKYQWFINESDEIYLFIKRKDDTPLSSTKSYTVTLTEFKNKRFENLDLYVHCFSDVKEFITLTNTQNEGTFIFNSNYTNSNERAEIQLKMGSENFFKKYFESNDNYFDTDNIKIDSYNEIKYKFYNNILYIKRNDSSNITTSNVIDIKLKPQTNMYLKATTQLVKNVQQALDELTKRVNSISFNPNPDWSKPQNLMDKYRVGTIKELMTKMREDIAQANFDKINLGDYFIINQSIADASYDPEWTDKLKVVVVALNHYKNKYSNGNNTQNHIVCQFENIIELRRIHASSCTQYINTEVHSYLNGTFKTALENILGISLIENYISYSQQNSSSGWSKLSIFLPSGFEVMGNRGAETAVNSFIASSYFFYRNPSQTQYALYQKEPWRIVKRKSKTDDRYYWWLRDSMDPNSSPSSWCYVNSSGYLYYHSVTYSDGVSPAFCI